MPVTRRDVLKAGGAVAAAPLSSAGGAPGPVSFRNKASGFLWTLPKAKVEPIFVAGERSDAVAARLQRRDFPGLGVIEFQCVFENRGPSVVPGVSAFGPLRVRLRRDLGPLQVHAMRRNSYAIECLPVDRLLELSGGRWNGPEHAGLIALEAMEAREFLYVGIEWERGWKWRINRANEECVLEVFVTDLRHDMAPGEKLTSPRVFVGTAAGGPDAAVQSAQRYLKKHVYPPPPKDFPWVVYDIWGTEAEGVEKALLDEVDFAADLGVELFYVDASWYQGSSKKGTGDWGCGIGRYTEDREKFPHGLRYLSDRVHERGMRFGLWVGPNIVDQRLVPDAIPSRWVAKWQGADRVLNIKAWEAPCLQVCLGCREYIDYLKTNLSRIVRDFRLDWLKWDNSGIPGIPGQCDRADHGHQAGDGSFAALAGQYEIFQFLHREFPDLVLEQCGYGSRHDLGLARTIRANWLSDASFPSAHVRENAMVARFAYPSWYNGGWVIQEDPDLEKAKDDTALDTLFRSRMMGLFGFGTMYGKLSERVSLFRPEVLTAARRNIGLYKKLRHLLRGDSHALFPPSGSPEGWQAIEFVEGNEALIYCFRWKSTQSALRIPVRGFGRREEEYEIFRANSGRTSRIGGDQLRREGIIVELPRPESSEVLWVSRRKGSG